ncbi:MAG: hypothetical protein WBQ10_08595 [Terriglobales bacterium]
MTITAVYPRMLSFFFLALLGVFFATCAKAQYVQGEPTVGNSSMTTGPGPSQMLIDATQFAGAPDMCLQIKNACLKLGTAGYPGGWPMLSLCTKRGCPVLLAFFARGRGF